MPVAIMGALSLAWNLGKNVGFIFKSVKTISSLVEEMAANGKKLPDCDQASAVIDILEEALRRKVIDLPNVDEDKVADWLDEQKREIFQCQIPKPQTKLS